MLLALLVVTMLQASGPTVVAEALGENRHRLTITFTTDADDDDLQRRVVAETSRLCGPRHVHFGRYEFEGNQAVTGPEAGAPGQMVVRHEFECRDEPPPPPPPPTTGPVDTSSLQPVVEALVSQFFAAVDAGDYVAAYALTNQASGSTEQEWSERHRARRAQVGVRTSQRRFRTTWYVDPPGAEHGVYVGVDHDARHQEARVCGAVVWYRPTGSTEFRVNSTETTVIPHQDVTPEVRAGLEAAGRCIPPPPGSAA